MDVSLVAAWNRHFESRDPLEVLIEREARTCAGCIHKGYLWGAAICMKTDKLADKRCGRYKEKK